MKLKKRKMKEERMKNNIYIYFFAVEKDEEVISTLLLQLFLFSKIPNLFPLLKPKIPFFFFSFPFSA